MALVGNARLLLLMADLDFKLGRLAVKLRNHHVELRQLAPFFIHLKKLQPNQVIA